MGFVFFVATSVVLTVLRPTFADINCEDDVHVNCPSNSLYNAITDSAGFFSEKLLTESCSVIIEDISCKDNYLNACDHDNYKLYSLLTNGLKDLFSELCNETSDLRIGYRKHIDCYKRSSTQFSTCLFLSLQAARRSHSESHGPLSEEQQVTALCKFQELFRSCTIAEVKRSCSEEASTYLAAIYLKAVQDLVSELC